MSLNLKPIKKQWRKGRKIRVKDNAPVGLSKMSAPSSWDKYNKTQPVKLHWYKPSAQKGQTAFAFWMKQF